MSFLHASKKRVCKRQEDTYGKRNVSEWPTLDRCGVWWVTNLTELLAKAHGGVHAHFTHAVVIQTENFAFFTSVLFNTSTWLSSQPNGLQEIKFSLISKSWMHFRPVIPWQITLFLCESYHHCDQFQALYFSQMHDDRRCFSTAESCSFFHLARRVNNELRIQITALFPSVILGFPVTIVGSLSLILKHSLCRAILKPFVAVFIAHFNTMHYKSTNWRSNV